jgi:hypothetical protein
MEACYGGTDVMERSCAVAREIDINSSRARPVKRFPTALARSALCSLKRALLSAITTL